MANTVTQTTLEGSGNDSLISRVIHITSDGTEESDLVIFDNSAFGADTSKGRLVMVEANGSNCSCLLEWDADTNTTIVKFNPNDNFHLDFTKMGGGGNPNNTGATGDILLSTGSLDAGDEITIKIVVQQN